MKDADSVVSMTHHELALEVGTAREVISRRLKCLERFGFLKLYRGKIRILGTHCTTDAGGDIPNPYGMRGQRRPSQLSAILQRARHFRRTRRKRFITNVEEVFLSEEESCNGSARPASLQGCCHKRTLAITHTHEDTMAENDPNRTSDSNGAKPFLKSVHRCIRCGATLPREGMTEDEMITGVVGCRQCGVYGPLSVTIVEDEQD